MEISSVGFLRFPSNIHFKATCCEAFVCPTIVECVSLLLKYLFYYVFQKKFNIHSYAYNMHYTDILPRSIDENFASHT